MIVGHGIPCRVVFAADWTDWTDWTDWSIEKFRTLKAKCRTDWIGWIGLDWLSYTAVTPRASLKSDANNNLVWPLYIQMLSTMNVSC